MFGTMKPSSLAFLKRLLDTPGPSGFETGPARVWRAEAEGFADQVTTDVKGNSLAAINPDAAPRIMFAGHIDEIGLMIVHVDDEGFLYFGTIGGWDSQVLVGQRVKVIAKAGIVDGVIGKKAIHLIHTEDRDKVSKVTDLWIDIGARNKKDALKRIRVGDPAVLAGDTVQLPNDRIVSRSIDNRIGAFVVLEALRQLKGRRPKAGVYAVATAQEEIAWTGGGARTSASGLNPSVALVVDVTHATDHPGVEKKEVGDFKLGGGPVLSRGSAVNPVVFDLLVEIAEAEKIPYTLAAAPRDTGTDADAIHTAHHGVATGLVSVPNRYMHTPNEMVELEDLDRTARLLAAFARRVTPKTDFTPR
jgi:endoglucanase